MTDNELLNDHELLMELVEEKRKNEKMNVLKFSLFIAFMIAMFVMVYLFLNKIYTTVAGYGQVITQVEQMAGKVDVFIRDSQSSLSDLTGLLDKETIDQLKTVLEQLSSLGNIFGF